MKNMYIIGNDTYNVEDIDDAFVDVGEYIFTPLYKIVETRGMFGKIKQKFELERWYPYARVVNDEEDQKADFHVNRTLNKGVNYLFDVNLSDYDEKITQTRNKFDSMKNKMDKLSGRYKLYNEEKGYFKAQLTQIPPLMLSKYNMIKPLIVSNYDDHMTKDVESAKKESVQYLCIIMKNGKRKYYCGDGLDIEDPSSELATIQQKIHGIDFEEESYSEYEKRTQPVVEKPKVKSSQDDFISKKDFSKMYQIREEVVCLKNDLISGAISEQRFNQRLRTVLDDPNLKYITRDEVLRENNLDTEIEEYSENTNSVNDEITDFDSVEKKSSISNLVSELEQIDTSKKVAPENNIPKTKVDDFETRLKKLKLLHDNNMISEEEYQNKIQEIMSEL